MPRLLVLDVVGLTPRLIADMPNLRAVADVGFQARLDTVLPAVTCSVQSTFLTGSLPREHGIVGNGWYFRDLGEVFLWRQHNRLVHGEKIWEAARRERPGYTVANMGWWYAMGADVDWTLTPRPIYYSDGRKEPDCYTDPPELHDELTAALGTFPLFDYWGPTASIRSSQWIVDATRHVLTRHGPDLTLAYLPHLDYDLQRYGPDSPRARDAARAVDAAMGPLLRYARAHAYTVVVLSEYGITGASRPVDINRMLRAEGLLRVHTQAGMEFLDPWTSRAFAVADHQIAHVYVPDPADRAHVSALLAKLPGVAEVLDEDGRHDHGLDHERAGDLVAIADPEAWFTYYYWLDDARAPDFARQVEIHRKPGYDPAELFWDPSDRAVKVKAGIALARKKLGLRYRMSVVPLDPSPVRGTHGRLPADPDDGPILLCDDPTALRHLPGGSSIHATEVKRFLLDLGADRKPA
ncbi:alkaline phosphatase family protein [Embleya scabrispora]|uniref:alkaline phosphatase family protein n=1 Tax=Embleya scabrispora TaxID=159449 RepID=UPI0003816B89|nr:nucleotide pyrophosphatase/phosphodiesterase family protein [Embleya scabrispora]MYS80603.1 alkaline phosphatase family protein [Streptomyces sp. SID5474]